MGHLCLRFLFIFIFFVSLGAEELSDPFISSLSRTQSLLPITIQSVSAISGEWLESETDFVVKGPNSIVLSRFYSSDGYSGKLGYGWEFNHPYQLVVDKGSQTYRACLHHPLGFKSLHEGKEVKGSVSFLPLSCTIGLTNCCSGEISGKTNLHNVVLKIDREKKRCEAITGSGHVVCYKEISNSRCFNPEYERMPNGNLLLFDDDRIVSTNADESIQYGKIKFLPESIKKLKIKTNDQREATYVFDCYSYQKPPLDEFDYRKPEAPVDRRYSLTLVRYTHKPNIEYTYDYPKMEGPVEFPPDPLLKKKKWGEDRFQEVTYYKEGDNSVDSLRSISISKGDFREFRVKEIKAPVGSDEKPIVTHRFIYLTDDYASANRGERFSGKTEVYDAEMNKTVYTYNKKHRPRSILRYSKNGEVYSQDRFVWNEGEKVFPDQKLFFIEAIIPESDELEMITEPNSFLLPVLASQKRGVPHNKILDRLLKKQAPKDFSQVGNLIGKFREDKEGNIQHALFFTYDSKGNIEEETFYGNLTGTNFTPIELNGNNLPKKNGVERYKKTFTYSGDSFNHLLTEKEKNGKTIEYTYHPKNGQVAAKYIKDGENIHLRQFFFYDKQTAALIKVIKDDGSQTNSDDLTDVKERLITSITLNNEYPFGAPKTVEDKYWDGTREALLKKVEYFYYPTGEVERQDHYDANGNFCYSLFWKYDRFGNVIEEKNALGSTIERKYDKNNNLVFEKGPRPNDYTEYFYDYSNRLKLVQRYADGKCLTTQHTYDLRGNRTSTIDSFGQTTYFEYDEFNRLAKTTYPPILLNEEWLFTPTLKTSYDIDDHPIQIKEPGDWITTLSYNARGKPTAKTYPDGTIEKFEYYLDGTLAKSISKTGTQTIYKRDFLGRILEEKICDPHDNLISTQTFTYKGSKLISKVDPENCITSYSYDGAGRVVSEICSNSHTVYSRKTYTYDSLNRVSQIIQSFGDHPEELSIQAFAYDFLGQVIEERLEDAAGNILQKICYTYDEIGNKTSTKRETQAGESTTFAEYQADGKPLVITDAEKNKTYFTYDHTYQNALGQTVLQIIKTDPLGRNTYSTFDALGRLREVTQKDPFGTLLSKQEIFYDPTGKVIKTIDHVIIQGKVHRHYINAWSYHPSGQPDLIVEAASTPEQKITRISYNAFSQKEKVIKPNGVQLYYTYDDLGRVKTLHSSDETVNYTYTYNLLHQIQQVEDKKNQTLTTRHYNAFGQLEEEILENGLNLKYSYDQMGRLKNLTLPDSSSVFYSYNAAYLKEIQRYKQGNLLYSHQNIQHDLSGSLLKTNLIGKAGIIHTSYDILGRVQSIQSSHWSQHIPISGYDSVGRLLQMTTDDLAGTTNYAFQYNALDHLEAENGQVSHQYQTDSIHNRLHKNGISCKINALNQLKEHGNCTYNYDLAGNLYEKIKDGQKTTYLYDALDRLISVNSPQETTTYHYDAFHRRISKTHQGITSRYLYQGEDEIGCVNAQGEITELRILGIGLDAEIGAAIALELHGKTYAPLHDRQGNVVCLIDAITGQIAETYRYTAFGEEAIFNAQGEVISHSDNPWRYCSKRMDPETGWIYFGRRYYDPETGRWTTPDPASFADGPNLYAYLHHNPINAYDAYGLFGRAYQDFCKPEFSRTYFSDSSDSDSWSSSERFDRTSANEERREYIGSFQDQLHHGMAGAAHGAVDFTTNQICGLASFACSIGCHEIDDLEERMHTHAAYSQWQANQMNRFDNWFAQSLGADPNNSLYQTCRSYTTAGLEIGSLLTGSGYGIVKGSGRALSFARNLFSSQGSKISGKVATQELKHVVSQQITTVTAKAGRNRFIPDQNAIGAHTVFRRDPIIGRVTHYETYRLQTNPRNPNKWESCLRFDNSGKVNQSHFNKILKKEIYEPHIHNPFSPGGVRPAELWEIPN